MTIKEIEAEIVEEFSFFGDDWEAKYEHLIDIGKSLPLIDDKYKTDNRLIQGCQSKVWLHAQMNKGLVQYTADSDAIITKGLVALIIRVLSNHAPDEIIETKLNFINEIGLATHLSPTRANGLLSMINQMKLDALAFKTTLS